MSRRERRTTGPRAWRFHGIEGRPPPQSAACVFVRLRACRGRRVLDATGVFRPSVPPACGYARAGFMAQAGYAGGCWSAAEGGTCAKILQPLFCLATPFRRFRRRSACRAVFCRAYACPGEHAFDCRRKRCLRGASCARNAPGGRGSLAERPGQSFLHKPEGQVVPLSAVAGPAARGVFAVSGRKGGSVFAAACKKGRRAPGVRFRGVTPAFSYFFFPKWRMWPIFSCLVRI